MRVPKCLPVLFVTLFAARSLSAAEDLRLYRSLCDASAGVALDMQHFVIADDESKSDSLTIFRRDKAEPLSSKSFDKFLDTPKGKEADIEGSAMIGDRIYWITSHARNKKGEPAPERHRLFATVVKPGDPPTLEPVGIPYKDLLQAMLDSELLVPYRLEEASKLAPKSADSLNIEGLAATADGGLLIGFRSPIRNGKALVLPLTNPQSLVEGKAAPAFGTPLSLDLGGLGIRSMERIGSRILIVAGAATSEGSFALYEWSGRASDSPRRLPTSAMDGLNPEVLFSFPDGVIRIASDDGAELTDQIACKDRKPAKREFRSVSLPR